MNHADSDPTRQPTKPLFATNDDNESPHCGDLTPYLVDTASLAQLSPEERSQLEQSCRQLEMLYAKSPQNGTSQEWDGHLGILDSHFGRFEVIRGLGMGGEGVVFLARDPVLDRLVALKVPIPGALMDASRRHRFLTEGRASALLMHPNIVTVFESGEVGTICYLAQDYIRGRSLAAWLRDHPQPVTPFVAARVMLQLADAVALAHSRKILHRDIKPGNILLAPSMLSASVNGLEDFIPKLSDFGLAKLTQDSKSASTEVILGTPAYMSPEQAAGHSELIGPASDIYSLGAVLHEMLTHQKLYRGETPQETIQKVLNSDPPPLCSIMSGIPRDLEAICLKCLRREPQERYHSATDLAEDLRRFLDDRPVVARPLSFSAVIHRWSRRNPAVVALLSTVCLALISLLVGSFWFNARLNASLEISRQHERNLKTRTIELQRRVYGGDLRHAAEAWQDGRVNDARHRLNSAIPLPGQPELRSFPWWMLSHLLQNSSHVIGNFEAGTTSAAVAVDAAGDIVACGEPDGVIRLRSLPEGRLIGELRGHMQGTTVNSLHFSPPLRNKSDQVRQDFSSEAQAAVRDTLSGQEVQLLVSGGDDGTVRVWDLSTQLELLVLRGHQGKVNSAIFIGSEAEAIASGGEDRIIRIWDRHSGQLLSELTGHADIVRSLQEKSDIGLLFSAAEDATIRIWDWKSARPSSLLADSDGLHFDKDIVSWARSIAISPDGTELAAGFRSGHLIHWDIETKKDLFGTICRDHLFASGIRTLAWRDEQTLVAGFGDSRMLNRSLPDSPDCDEFLAGHSDWILSVDDIPGRKGLVSAAKDGTIRYWPESTMDGQIHISSSRSGVHSNPDWTNSVLTVVLNDSVLGYRMPEATPLFRLVIDGIAPGAWTSVTTDGARLLTTQEVGHQGKYLTAIEIGTAVPGWQLALKNHYPSSGSHSPDGKQIVVCVNQELWSVDVDSGRRNWIANHPLAVNDVQFVPQKGFIVTVCMDGKIRTWDPSTGRMLHEKTAHTNSAQQLAVSPDGQLLATAGEDLLTRVWRISDWKEVATFGLKFEAGSLWFADEGRTLIVHDNNELTFWSVPDQIEVMSWNLHKSGSRIIMSPDNLTLAVQDGHRIQLFDGSALSSRDQE